jgi:hypothetical protein
VLVLRPPAQTPWPELVEALASAGRVIIPETPDGEDDFLPWLRDFLDGVGVPSAALVAMDGLCVRALGFASLEGERVRALVLVPREAAAGATLAGEPPSVEGGAARVLVVRGDEAPDEAIARILEFLRGDGRGGPDGDR